MDDEGIKDKEIEGEWTKILEHDVHKSVPTKGDFIETPEGSKSITNYINNTFTGPLSKVYFKIFITSSRKKLILLFATSGCWVT